MSSNPSRARNRALVIAGLGGALLVSIFLSPFASQAPDGLDRVSKDLKFEDKVPKETPAQKLPFYAVFDSYALRGVPEKVATPIAGMIGTLVAFGLAWGFGKLVVRGSGSSSTDHHASPYSDDPDQPLD